MGRLHVTHLDNATPEQKLALHDLKQVLKTVEDFYNSRHYFKLANGNTSSHDILHHQIRISITYNELIEVGDIDDDGNPLTYEENREDEFYLHIWYDRGGHIWFLVNDRGFPTFGKDIAYRGELDNEYDWITSGHGSRRYFFGDVVFPAVTHNFINKIKDDYKGHYVWNMADISIFSFFENEDVSVYTT